MKPTREESHRCRATITGERYAGVAVTSPTETTVAVERVQFRCEQVELHNGYHWAYVDGKNWYWP